MENEQRIFMQSVIKQCSNFFLGLHKYCEEYSSNFATGEKPAKVVSKKSAEGSPRLKRKNKEEEGEDARRRQAKEAADSVLHFLHEEERRNKERVPQFQCYGHH